MTLFQYVFVPLCLLLGVRALAKVPSSKLPKWQAVSVGVLWLLGGLLIWFPATATIAASWLGIGRGSDLIFYLGLLGGFYACILFYGRYRKLEILITDLIRKNAIYNAQQGSVIEAHPDKNDPVIR
jgi:small membrane protein